MNVAIITGAASGIGLALSHLYLKNNCLVVMVDKNEHLLQKEWQALEAYQQYTIPVVCDITKPKEVEDLFQTIKHKTTRIDWLFNNAGIIGALAPVWDTPVEAIQEVMNVNLYGMIHMIQALMPLLFAQTHRSHIINIASLYGVCSGGQVTSYAMSKHAVLALSESMYYDLKRMEKPVDVSVAFPSFTDTTLLNSPSSTRNAPAFHGMLDNLMSHSQSAQAVAQCITNEVEQKKFYLFPNQEVKEYSEQRVQAMIKQEPPHMNEIEQLMHSLIKRSERSERKK